MRTREDLKVNHPDYQLTFPGSAAGGPVVWFERRPYHKPTELQRRCYRLRQWLVEKLGGRMKDQEYQIGGETEAFTQADVEEMLNVVVRDFPTYEIVRYWNGVGTRTFSVMIKERV